MAKTKNPDIYTSETHNYLTDPRIVNAVLDFIKKDKFKADLACSEQNIPAEIYITEKEDSLQIDWPKEGDLWLNPPYGRPLEKFVRKCSNHIKKNPNCIIWLILPVRSENIYYHESIYKQNTFTFFFAKKQFFSKDGTFIYKSGFESPFSVQLSCFCNNPKELGKKFKDEFKFLGTVMIEI